MCGNEGGVFLECLIIGLRFDDSHEPNNGATTDWNGVW